MTSTSIVSEFKATLSELDTLFIGRKQEITGLALGTLSQHHVLLVGVPGTGKSALIKKWAEVLGVRVFDRLMTEFTTPDELFGPVDLESYKTGVYRRIITGKAPDCELVFLDEVFKSSSSILNSLLRLMQEREYDNDGTSIKTPLMLMVGASNETPSPEDGLDAFYDRFLLRYEVRPMTDEDEIRRLLTTDISKPVSPIPADHVKQAQDEVARMVFTEEANNSIVALWEALRDRSIRPSDRRLLAMKRVMAADSWLQGFGTVMPESISVARNILWSKSTEYGVVSELAQKSLNPYEDAVKEIVHHATVLKGDLAPGRTTRDDALEAIQSLVDMRGQLREIEQQAKGAQRTPVTAAIGRVETIRKAIGKDYLGLELV